MNIEKHINAVKTFCAKAGQPVPNKIVEPTEKDKVLRAKLIMEEAFEMIEALGLECNISPKDMSFTNVGPADSVAVMDAVVDLLWVGVTGPSVLIGASDVLVKCIEEVDRSNLSKFIDGHRDPDTGKWIKGPSYSPANLKDIIHDKGNT